MTGKGWGGWTWHEYQSASPFKRQHRKQEPPEHTHRQAAPARPAHRPWLEVQATQAEDTAQVQKPRKA